MQGIVRSVSGYLAEVEVEGLTIPDVRLRASAVAVQGAMIIIPAVGSVVLVGSLSGDMTELAVLYVDKVDRVELSGEVVLNGGGPRRAHQYRGADRQAQCDGAVYQCAYPHIGSSRLSNDTTAHAIRGIPLL